MRSSHLVRGTLLACLAVLAACSGGGSGGGLSIVSSVPASGAVSVPVESDVSVTFNQELSSASVNAGTFSISPSVGGTIAVNGAVATFSHSAPFAPSTLYTATLSGSISDAAGDTLSSSQTLTFTTAGIPDNTPPAQVTTLAVSATTSTTATLAWTAVGDNGNSGTASSYKLHYATGSSCPLTASNFAAAKAVTTAAPKPAGSAETATASGLTALTAYCFGLTVTDKAGNVSPLSNIATGTTANPPDTTPPAAVTDLAAAATSFSAIHLTWTAPGDNGTTGTAASYNLREASGAACPITDATFAAATAVTTTAPHVAGTAESADATGLTAATTYCFALETSDAAMNVSALSNVATQATPAAPPGVIGDLAATAVAETVTLTWTSPAHPDSSATYDIYTAPGACPANSSGFILSATDLSGVAVSAAGMAETKTISGLNPSSPYCFGITLTDMSVISALSNLAGTTTGDDIPPATVSMITVGTVGSSSVQLSWTAPGDNGSTGTVTSYDLRYAASACSAFVYSSQTNTKVPLAGPFAAGGATETRTVTGLTSGTTYCFALTATDAAHNTSAVSATATATTTTVVNTTPPAAVTDLSGLPNDATSVALSWTAPGQHGTTGTVASYNLQYAAVASTATDCTGFVFGTGTTPGMVSGTLVAAGSTQTQTTTSLMPLTNYCFALTASDGSSDNSAVSNSAFTHTKDTAVPSTMTLALMGGSITASGASFTAVSPNPNDISSTAKVASYQLVYIAGDCTGTPNFNGGTPVTTGTPSAQGATDTFTVTSLAPSTSYCFGIASTDSAGNQSAFSAGVSVDTIAGMTPPGAVTNLAVGNATQATVTLSWNASTGDSGAGVAASYVGGYIAAADCSAQTSFAGTTAITGLPTPAASGTVQSVIVSGLAKSTSYCFLIEALDSSSVPSPIASVAGSTAVAASSTQIAAVRSAIAAGATPGTSIALSSLPITNATVSYVKPASTLGVAPDGPGFFLQTDPGGPAIYVAIAAASFLDNATPAMAPGDVVSLTATTGAWLDCTSCNVNDTLYVITAATGSRSAVAGAPVPPSLPLASTNIVIPASTPNWTFDEVLVSGQVTLTAAFATSGVGYYEAAATTLDNTAETSVTLRLPTTVMASVGATNHCMIQVNSTPLWRFGSSNTSQKTEVSAWQASDLSMISCQAPNLISNSPTNNVTEARLTPTLMFQFDSPMDPTTFTTTATGGACSGLVQLTTASDTSTCIAIPSFATDPTGQWVSSTLTSALSPNTSYVLTFNSGEKSTNGNVFTAAAQTINFKTAATDDGCSNVVISQIYGGGGNTAATYLNDFVELYNKGATQASLTGCSLQYTSSSNTAAWGVTPLTPLTACTGGSSDGLLDGFVIPAGGYFLVQEVGGSTASSAVAVPSPDLTSTVINLSATDGTVALSPGPVPIAAGTCPARPAVSDLVGYGVGVCDMGGGDAPKITTTGNADNQGSILRKGSGATDTGVNSADFATNPFSGGTGPRNDSGAMRCNP